MAKKKPGEGGKKPRRRTGRRDKTPKGGPAAGAPLPDRRAMERVLSDLVKGMAPGGGGNRPIDRAQEIMYQAFEARDPWRQVELARQALEVSPDCADAYVLLAEHATNRKEALELYRQAVAAGERALGPQTFRDAAGHFWGILETRPYMRARAGLAHSLWTAGQRDEAVGHLQDMLRLNPGDNQGLRYTLAGFLLSLDRDDDLARLLDQYPDEGSAAWAYTRALLAFRRGGDTPAAHKLLTAAKKVNKHVPDYLTGRKFPPHEQPDSYSPGQESEALMYIGNFLPGWKATPGALAWLREQEPGKKSKPPAPRARGPLPMVKRWLTGHLAQGEEAWEADFRQLPGIVETATGRVYPWLLVVVDGDSGAVLAHGIEEQEPTAAALWDLLVAAMQQPLPGNPHRPAAVQVRPHPHWDSLRPHLQEVGVELTPVEELPGVVEVFDHVVETFGPEPEPGLLHVPGVTPERVAGFYDAAALFFTKAPWTRVGYEQAIEIQCAKFQSGPWYAVLMGQSGLMMGLSLYESLDTLRTMWARERDDEENARMTVATTVTFGEDTDTPQADVDAARQHGWKVARPDAYPHIFHKERGMSTRPPLAWELELMEGCLRAVPEFVKRHRQEDTTAETMTVPVVDGELTLTLAWVDDEA